MFHVEIIKDGDVTKVQKEILVDGQMYVDETPREGSVNLVTSDGVKKAIDDTKESVDEDVQDLQDQIDDIAQKAGSGYIAKGEASVSTLNALTGQENGWLYTLTDSGTLTDGSLAVVAGDTVAWDDTNSVWYKAMNYAPAQYGTDQVKNLPAKTSFSAGDKILVAGSTPGAMSKDDLLAVTAQNALGSIHSLSDTATEADLVTGNYFALGGTNIKKFPAQIIPACKVINRGEANVATLNALTFKQDGWSYLVKDSGTLNAGSFSVNAGERVIWYSYYNKWFKTSVIASEFDADFCEDNLHEYEKNVVSLEVGELLTPTLADGFLEGYEGQTLTIGAQAYWTNGCYSVTAGKKYQVKTKLGNNSFNNGYIFATDDSLNIIKVLSVAPPWNNLSTLISRVVTIPTGATKLYVLCDGNQSLAGNRLFVNEVNELSIIGVLDNYKKNPTYEKVEYLVSATLADGFISGIEGQTLTTGSQAYWTNGCYSVTAGKKYKVKTKINANVANAGDGIIYAVNDSLTVIKVLAKAIPIDDYSKLVENEVTIPTGATKLYVLCDGNQSLAGTRLFVNEVNEFSIIEEFDDYKKNPTYETDGTLQTPTLADGFIQGSEGGTLTTGTQLYWTNGCYSVTAGKKYHVRTKINANVAGSGSGIIYAVDDNLKIIKILANAHPIDDYSKLVDNEVTIPTGATKLYVLCDGNQIYSPDRLYVYIVDFVSIKDAVEKAGDFLPGYYYPYIDGKIDDVSQKQSELVKGISFVFLTDSHWAYNSLNSGKICREVLKRTSVPFVIHGGDFVSAYGTRQDIEYARINTIEFINEVGKDKVFVCRGNHDFTISNSALDPTNGATLPLDAVYDALVRHVEMYNDSVNALKCYYFIENKAQKVRVFIVNSCEAQSNDPDAGAGVYYYMYQEQIDFIKEHTQSVSGYSFVFVSHVTADPNLSGYHSEMDPLQEIASAINNKTGDYADTTNKVMCCIAGHAHRDASDVYDGVLHILTTCDARYEDDGADRVNGSVTEQAIDVFHIDTYNNTIKTTRIGSGSDRSWSLT